MPRHDPERVAVYRLARQHTRAVRDLLSTARTRGFADLVDQMRRSAASITANIKEGLEEFSPKEKAHCFRIAKRSAAESWAHTDNLVDFGLVREEMTESVRDLQDQVIALLVTMIRNLESGGGKR